MPKTRISFILCIIFDLNSYKDEMSSNAFSFGKSELYINMYVHVREQDKSSDIEQQSPFMDPK